MGKLDLRLRDLETAELLIASFESEDDAATWLRERPHMMEVRRLGLGARLEPADLVRLLPSARAAAATAVATLLGTPPDDAADVVLDLALEYGKRRDPGLRTRIERLAPLAGLDASRLLRLEAGQAAG